MLLRQYTLNPLRPAYFPEIAEKSVRPVALPVGGPIGVGGKFALGTVLGCVGGAPTNEIWTLAINGATGTVTFTFVADKPYICTFAVNASLATVQAALQTIFGGTLLSNVSVGSTPGTSYTITFQNFLANRLMGGAVTVTATSGTPTLTRTTPGSCGAGQFNAYPGSAGSPVPRCFQKWDYTTAPTGAIVTDQPSTGQPSNAEAYQAGFFNVSDLVGLDASAISASYGIRLVAGAAITDTGAVVGLCV